MEQDTAQQTALVRARATVSLPGLSVGRSALVDPSDAYIAERLELGYLVAADVEAAAETPESE